MLTCRAGVVDGDGNNAINWKRQNKTVDKCVVGRSFVIPVMLSYSYKVQVKFVVFVVDRVYVEKARVPICYGRRPWFDIRPVYKESANLNII